MECCSLCKIPIPENEPDSWFTDDGECLNVRKSAIPTALAETSLGEIYICETCYQKGLPVFFTSDDLAQIHYQFGLEYHVSGNNQRSIESLSMACQIAESAEILAALALAESEIGHIEAARALYLRALEIDPQHFMSIENLKILK